MFSKFWHCSPHTCKKYMQKTQYVCIFMHNLCISMHIYAYLCTIFMKKGPGPGPGLGLSNCPGPSAITPRRKIPRAGKPLAPTN